VLGGLEEQLSFLFLNNSGSRASPLVIDVAPRY
jgi:hypothetical protein